MDSQTREYYQCPPGSNCVTHGLPLQAKTLQDVQTPCSECASIHSAFTIRTPYDQYWLKFYNAKAQQFSSNVMDLQFQR